MKTLLSYLLIIIVSIHISCSGSLNECKTDRDCPSILVCRENRCVGLYELDIKDYGVDLLDSFWRDGLIDEYVVEIEDVERDIKEDIFSDVEVFDGEVVILDGDDIKDLGDIDDIEIIQDIIEYECSEDEDCKRGIACIEDFCIDGFCNSRVNNGYCYIDKTCYENGKKNPFNDCYYCNSAIDQFGWSILDDLTPCAEDNNDCTYDVCKGGKCTHPYKESRTKCYNGICDGIGHCVKCIDDSDCDNSNFDTKCEGYYCDKGECIYYSREGHYCGTQVWECYVCRNKKCVCNTPHFNCNNCVPSCGYQDGICCPLESSCSQEWISAYDCDRCCKGVCIPY